MYPQPAHNPRLGNGVPGGRSMGPMMFGYVQQSQANHGHHAAHNQPHHQSLQQEHSNHSASSTAAAAALNHPASFSSSLLTNVTPFAPSSHQNGHTPASRATQAQPLSEHMQEQLKIYKESERAHDTMTTQHQPHYFARMKAAENRGIAPALLASGNDGTDNNEGEDRGRPVNMNMEKSDDRQDWHSLDLSGQGLRAVSLVVFDRYVFLKELYLPSNNLTHLPPAIGQLRSLRHLDLSFNQLTELPPELGMCTPLRKLLVFNNQIRTLPYELGYLHELEFFGIHNNPLSDEIIKHKMQDEGTRAVIRHLRENAPVPLPPQPRNVIPLQENISSNLERIKVLSWNTLCDKYASTQTYGYTPAMALTWEHRRESILQELRMQNADIMCLQETAGDAFESFFTPELAKADYRGVFWPKTRVSHITDKTERGTVDGCSIFFKNTKYILLDKQHVDFRNMAINRPDMKATEDVFNRVMPKDNIGVFCLFESRRTGARFIVVNAHLCWESHLADVKAIQTGILMEYVTKMSERYTRKPAVALSEKKLVRSPMTDEVAELSSSEFPEPPAPSQEYRSNTDIPLFVCGDYNSLYSSSVYELLSQGRVPPDHQDLVGHSYGNFTKEGISHPFSLRSAYAHVRSTQDDLSFTNYTPMFTGVIDYIWYSTNSLECVELLGPPDTQYLKRVPGFPNYHFPSDHIQIMAEFVLKARKDKKSLGGGGDAGNPGRG